MMWGDDPGRVNGRKGYGAVNRLYYCTAVRGTDGVYPGSDCGNSEHLSSLPLRLVLIIARATQYIVDGGPRFRWEFYPSNYSSSYGGGFCFAGRLPNVSSEVPSSDQFFHQELQASAMVSFMVMVMVPMVIAAQRLIALLGVRLHWWGPFKVGVVPDER